MHHFGILILGFSIVTIICGAAVALMEFADSVAWNKVTSIAEPVFLLICTIAACYLIGLLSIPIMERFLGFKWI